MKIQHWLRFTFPAATILMTSCGGGGGGSSGPGAIPAPAASASASALGHMQILVPGATTSSQNRRAASISPAASSISIAVTGLPTPQIADISATSPNCTPAASGGRLCTIPVQAPVGTDVFTVTIFDGPNATGHQLATGSAGTTVVPGIPFSVTITLSGIISALQFVIGNNGSVSPPGPPGGPGTTDIGHSSIGPPVGNPVTTLGTVAAKDASGNYIVGAYNTTITITSSDPSITVTPGTLTGSGLLTFSYNGSGTVPVTLTATAAATSSSPAITLTKVVTPSTSLTYYPTPTINPTWISTGPDGKIYITENGPNVLFQGGFVGGGTPGKIARFDPVTKTFAGEVTVGNSPRAIAWAPDGSFFETNTQDNPATVGHVTGFSTYTPFTLPNSNFSGPRPMVLGPDGNVWYATVRGVGNPPSAKVGTFNPLTPASITEYALPLRSGIQGMAVGPDGNMYLTDDRNIAVDQVTTAGAVTAFPLPGSGGLNSLSPFLRFIAEGSDGNMWITGFDASTNPSGVGLGRMYKLSTSGVFTNVPLPVPYMFPDSIAQGPSGTLIFADLGAGVGQVTSSGVITDYQFAESGCISLGGYPNDVTTAPDGSIWFTQSSCVQLPANETQGFIGHLQLASGWTAFPMDDTLYLSPGSTSQSQLLSMAESGDSSPFTVTSSNPGVATVASTASTHTFVLGAVGNGTTLITITDAHGNTLTKTVSVSSATGTVQSTSRRAQ